MSAKIFKVYLIFLFITAIPVLSFSQEKVMMADVDVIYANKNIPEELEPHIKKTLSYYPQLENVPIDFIFKDKIRKVTMQAQPRGRTLFKGKANRSYKVKMSRYLATGDSVISIEDVPNDILIGWIAHELGHIMDYRDRSAIRMIGFGIRYLTSNAFVKDSERRADIYAIQHGFADNIIKTKKYILEREDFPETYKERIIRFYISPEEVTALEEELGEM